MRTFLFLSLLCLTQCQTTSIRREQASDHTVVDSSGYRYDPNDKSCDGFPKLDVQTMPGTCLGMVMPRDRAKDPATDREFLKPRTIVQIPGSEDFMVLDMGGWNPNNGRLFLMTRGSSGSYELKLMKYPLDNPHGLTLAADGYYYLGEKTQISRFHLQGRKIADWQLVIGKLERKDGYMHPLSQFTFDPRNGDLYINAGSPSDHCFSKASGAYSMCPESEEQGGGILMRIPGERLKTIPADGIRFYEIVAKGLRNSMALAISPLGFLVQGENSRDFPELEEPYEEINVVDLNQGKGLHYGWPYCYDFHAISPEYLEKGLKPYVDCLQKQPQGVGDYQAPYSLMPPHVAPLHMNYYKGNMFSDLFGGKLLMVWHGYQPTGHRLVAYDIDAQGRPALTPNLAGAQFGFNQTNGCAVKKKFIPKGGMLRHAPYTEVISGWSAIKGVRPKGAPVSFTEADDGSLWIVEDRENRTVVRLARTTNANHQDNCDDVATDTEAPRVAMLARRHQIKSNPAIDEGYKLVQSELIQKHCLNCHGNMKANDIAGDRFSTADFFFKNDWVTPGDPQRSKLYGAIARIGTYTPMPPIDKPQFYGTPEGKRLNDIVFKWIQGLPTDEIESTFTSWKMQTQRNVRQKPGTDATVCGQVQTGDIVYGDVRPVSLAVTGTIKWTPIYMVPGHSRLKPGACTYPEDGVFWIAN